ncbi:hypothetical protein FO519_008611 [Halicephalobus sp. NKZ332]|nr:hypothetical protein FO519_008611 [Halicephalobus sp. NKZ332]
MVGVAAVMSAALGVNVTICGQTVEINMSQEALERCLSSIAVNVILIAAGITIALVGGTYVVSQFEPCCQDTWTAQKSSVHLSKSFLENLALSRMAATAVASPSNGVDEKCICELCECGNHKCPHNNGRLIGEDGVPVGQTEYESKYIEKPGERAAPFRPGRGTLANEGEMAQDTTHLADYKPWSAQRQLPGNEGVFDGTTTHQADYTKKEGARQGPVKPSSAGYRPTGPFDDTTTHLADYTGKMGSRQRPTKPVSAGRASPGAFDGTTTHMADYTMKGGGKQAPIKPGSAGYRPTGPFDDTTTHLADYKVFDVGKQQSFKPKSSRHLADGPFDDTTEHRANFDKKNATISKSFKPSEEYRPNSQPWEGQTTYMRGYTPKAGGRPSPVKPKEEWTLNRSSFNDFTTNQSDYTSKDIEKPCPAAMALANRSFRYTKTRDGHRFYKRTGLSNRDNFGRMALVSG